MNQHAGIIPAQKVLGDLKAAAASDAVARHRFGHERVQPGGQAPDPPAGLVRHRPRLMRHRLHDRLIRNLQVNLLQLDEAWSFVGCKQKRVKNRKRTEIAAEVLGDQYAFIGMDATRKAIISYSIGKRDGETTDEFAMDLRQRIVNRPQITTDGFRPYVAAIEAAFGEDVDYAMLVKLYAGGGGAGATAEQRYSPGHVIGVEKTVIQGNPKHEHISTSFVERQNLTLRMQIRRFTRLTNGFSKKLENHRAAMALHVAYYNFCRVHETLSVTPAMELGITDHVWSISELINVALAEPKDAPPPPAAPTPSAPSRPTGRPVFRVIQGGLA